MAGNTKKHLPDQVEPLNKKRKYNEFLGMKPDKSPGFLASVFNEPIVDAIKQKAEQDIAGLYLLLVVYGISKDDPSCWVELSLALARDYVKGFQMEEGKPSAPKKWGPLKQREIYECVQERIATGKSKSERQACFAIAEDYDTTRGNMYRRYKEFKKLVEEYVDSFTAKPNAEKKPVDYDEGDGGANLDAIIKKLTSWKPGHS